MSDTKPRDRGTDRSSRGEDRVSHVIQWFFTLCFLLILYELLCSIPDPSLLDAFRYLAPWKLLVVAGLSLLLGTQDVSIIKFFKWFLITSCLLVAWEYWGTSPPPGFWEAVGRLVPIKIVISFTISVSIAYIWTFTWPPPPPDEIRFSSDRHGIRMYDLEKPVALITWGEIRLIYIENERGYLKDCIDTLERDDKESPAFIGRARRLVPKRADLGGRGSSSGLHIRMVKGSRSAGAKKIRSRTGATRGKQDEVVLPTRYFAEGKGKGSKYSFARECLRGWTKHVP